MKFFYFYIGIRETYRLSINIYDNGTFNTLDLIQIYFTRF